MSDLERGHDYRITISKPSDTITVILDNQEHRVDIVDYLGKLHLNELAEYYDIKPDAVTNSELIRILRLRVRGFKEQQQNNEGFCCAIMLITIMALICIVVILCGLLAFYPN